MALASVLAVLVGVIMVVAGLARFSFVADLLSRPTQIGYMNVLALTIVVGQLPKLLVAIALSILNVFRRTWWPHQAELGRVEGLAGLHDTVSYPNAELLPGLVVYRFDAPLIFANARTFGETARAMAKGPARPAVGRHRCRAGHRRGHHCLGHA